MGEILIDIAVVLLLVVPAFISAIKKKKNTNSEDFNPAGEDSASRDTKPYKSFNPEEWLKNILNNVPETDNPYDGAEIPRKKKPEVYKSAVNQNKPYKKPKPWSDEPSHPDDSYDINHGDKEISPEKCSSQKLSVDTGAVEYDSGISDINKSDISLNEESTDVLKYSLVQGIVMSEILGKPKALIDE